MVCRRLTAFAVALCLATAASPTVAQSTQSLSRNLDALTDSVSTAMILTNFSAAHPEVAARMQFHLTKIDRIATQIRHLEEKPEVPFSATLRVSREKFHFEIPAEVAQDLQPSMDYIKLVMNADIRGMLDGAVGPERTDNLMAPLNAYLVAETRTALDNNLEVLRKLEIKYGPRSARLNILEAVINHVFLSDVKGFGLNDDGSPGPLELITAYSTAYFGRESGEDDNGLDVVSGFEFGLRVYIFAENWGQGNPLKPPYLSVGVLMSPEHDGIFREFDGDLRWGGFINWGSVKAAVQEETADTYRLLLSKQFQLIPAVF